MIPVAAYICDDDREYLDRIEEVFAEKGVTDCIFFQNPLDLIRSVKTNVYVFLIDQRMSGIDGLTITRRIVSLNPHALIIMLSMQDDVEVTAEFYESKGWKYLSKSKGLDSIKTAATWVKVAQGQVRTMLHDMQAVKDKVKHKTETIEWVRKNL